MGSPNCMRRYGMSGTIKSRFYYLWKVTRPQRKVTESNLYSDSDSPRNTRQTRKFSGFPHCSYSVLFTIYDGGDDYAMGARAC